MAKQSGLHQLRGKVGEHSYYRQTGIVPGLVRSINQGMSARVKTAPEYANARLNNAEFGAAASVAGLLGKMVVPKYRPMILPFSQSKMAKAILETARQSGGNWGERVVTSADTDALCEILTSTSKLAMSDFGSNSINRGDPSELTVGVNYTGAQATTMSELGISKLSINVLAFDLATGKYVAAEGGIHKSYYRLRASETAVSVLTAGTQGSVTADINIPESFSPTPETFNGHRIVVLVLMPIRTINNVDHVLQEYCSFVAAPIPEYE